MYSKEEFKIVCEGFLKRMLYTKLMCRIHLSCSDEGSMVEYGELLNAAPNFFKVSFNAIYQQAMLSTANLYIYGQSNEMTLHKLMKIIKSDSGLRKAGKSEGLDSVINKFSEYIIEKQEYITRLLEWRNRYIGHNDKRYFTDRSGIDEQVVLIAELEELLSFGVGIIRDIDGVLGLGLDFSEKSYENDLSNLLDEFEDNGSGKGDSK